MKGRKSQRNRTLNYNEERWGKVLVFFSRKEEVEDKSRAKIELHPFYLKKRIKNP